MSCAGEWSFRQLAGIDDRDRRYFHSGKHPVIEAAAASETRSGPVTADRRCQKQHPGSHSILIHRRQFRRRFQDTIFARQQIPPDIGDKYQLINALFRNEPGQKQWLAAEESGKIDFSAERDVSGNKLGLPETLQLTDSGADRRIILLAGFTGKRFSQRRKFPAQIAFFSGEVQPFLLLN